MTAGEQNISPSPEPAPGEQSPAPSPEPTSGEQTPVPSPEDVFASQMEKVEKTLDPKPPQPEVVDGEPSPEPTPEPTEPTPIYAKAPQNWDETRRQTYEALPIEQRKFLFETYKGFEQDYQSKAQQLAEYRRTMAEVVQNLNPTPQPTVAPEPEGDTPPEDPIERLKWETLREARLERQREREAELAHKTVSTIEEIKQQTAQNKFDAPIRSVLQAKVMQEPDVVNPNDPAGRTYRQIEFDRLDSDPVYFKHCYADAERRVKEHLARTQQKPSPAPSAEQTRRTVAPTLERPGVQTAPVADDSMLKRKQEIVKGIRKGKVDTHTLRDYLETVL